MAIIEINGVETTFDGKVVSVTFNLDGQRFTSNGPNVVINVTGDVGQVSSGSGILSVSGNIGGNVTAGSGDITCIGGINGNIQTGSGDVSCGTVGGKVSTGSGDVIIRR